MNDRPDANAKVRGAVFGLAAAASFGVSAPLSKLLLADIPPVLLAGLLYLGAGIALSAVQVTRRSAPEQHLLRADVPRLALLVSAGGLLGPVLMLFGLQRMTALSASLLLNLEAPLTMLVAVTLFREHLGSRALLAAALIVLGAAALKLEPGDLGASVSGIVLVAAACACWALDNNLTQSLSLRDPFALVRVKTLVSGTVNVALGLYLAGFRVPSAPSVVGALVLGSVSYGASVVLDAYALRLVGAAREAAYFATAPLIGVFAAVVVLGDTIRWTDVLAIALMLAGVGLLLRERHGHLHRHEVLEHEHAHVHDNHHQHTHSSTDPSGEPHAHQHRHEPLEHDHPHLPDAHHRHRH